MTAKGRSFALAPTRNAPIFLDYAGSASTRTTQAIRGPRKRANPFPGYEPGVNGVPEIVGKMLDADKIAEKTIVSVITAFRMALPARSKDRDVSPYKVRANTMRREWDVRKGTYRSASKHGRRAPAHRKPAQG